MKGDRATECLPVSGIVGRGVGCRLEKVEMVWKMSKIRKRTGVLGSCWGGCDAIFVVVASGRILECLAELSGTYRC